MLLAGMVPGLATAGPWDVGSTRPATRYKLKLKYEHKHARDKDSWSRPVLKLSGPLAPNLSFSVATGYGVVEKRAAPTRRGMQDLEAKLKWGLLAETDAAVDLLVEPKVTLDTGATGVGGGTTRFKLPLRAGRTLGDFYVTGEVRYTHSFAAADTGTAGYGALLEYRPGGRWIVGMDLFSDRPLHAPGKYHLRSNLAFKYKPGGRWAWQGLIGRSIENRRGQRATKIKVEAAYRL